MGERGVVVVVVGCGGVYSNMHWEYTGHGVHCI